MLILRHHLLFLLTIVTTLMVYETLGFFVASSHVVVPSKNHGGKKGSLYTSSTDDDIAPELNPNHVQRVNDLVAVALGDLVDGKEDPTSGGETDTTTVLRKAGRYASARSLATTIDDGGAAKPKEELAALADHQLVYGELSIPVLAKILDAVGVQKGEHFLDIGSGDGALVLGASLLYPEEIQRSVGVEILPGLVDRSKNHLERLKSNLASEKEQDCVLVRALEQVDFFLGDVYKAAGDHQDKTRCDEDGNLLSVLKDTLAICFATTWSSANKGKEKSSLDGRKLPQLSAALGTLPIGARCVIVDGRLNEADGFVWGGDLKVHCPDTAPYSIASLYSRI